MQSAAADALMPLLIFLLRTPPQWPTILFNGPDNPQNWPFYLVDLDPHLIRGSLFLVSQSPERQLDRFSRFRGVQPLAKQTDRQTDIQSTLHATSFATGRIYVVHALRPIKKGMQIAKMHKLRLDFQKKYVLVTSRLTSWIGLTTQRSQSAIR